MLRRDLDRPALRPHADGTLRYVDRQGHFLGIIHPDGRVELRDLPGVELDLETRTRVGKWIEGLAQAVDRPGHHDRPDLESPTPSRDDPKARADATVALVPSGPYGPPPILVAMGARFGGISDLALRRGQRRQTAAKQAFLDATAELREHLARQHAAELQRRALASIGQELATLWHDESLSLAERKRRVFERWDDCVEAEARSDTEAPHATVGREPVPDAHADADDRAAAERTERFEHAERMRRKIEAFVRLVAPPGSAGAFEPAELRQLNATRRSRQRFDPYTR